MINQEGGERFNIDEIFVEVDKILHPKKRFFLRPLLEKISNFLMKPQDEEFDRVFALSGYSSDILFTPLSLLPSPAIVYFYQEKIY